MRWIAVALLLMFTFAATGCATNTPPEVLLLQEERESMTANYIEVSRSLVFNLCDQLQAACLSEAKSIFDLNMKMLPEQVNKTEMLAAFGEYQVQQASILKAIASIRAEAEKLDISAAQIKKLGAELDYYLKINRDATEGLRMALKTIREKAGAK